MHGRGTAPAGQQRVVQVHPAVLKDVEDVLGDEVAVGYDRGCGYPLRCEVAQNGPGLVTRFSSGLEARPLVGRDGGLLSDLRDLRWAQATATPPLGVRLGNHRNDLDALIGDEVLEGHGGWLRGSGKDDLHCLNHSDSRICFIASRRCSAERDARDLLDAVAVAVENEDATGDADLVGGQAHSPVVIHGLQHVLD